MDQIQEKLRTKFSNKFKKLFLAHFWPIFPTKKEFQKKLISQTQENLDRQTIIHTILPSRTRNLIKVILNSKLLLAVLQKIIKKDKVMKYLI